MLAGVLSECTMPPDAVFPAAAEGNAAPAEDGNFLGLLLALLPGSNTEPAKPEIPDTGQSSSIRQEGSVPEGEPEEADKDPEPAPLFLWANAAPPAALPGTPPLSAPPETGGVTTSECRQVEAWAQAPPASSGDSADSPKKLAVEQGGPVAQIPVANVPDAPAPEKPVAEAPASATIAAAKPERREAPQRLAGAELAFAARVSDRRSESGREQMLRILARPEVAERPQAAGAPESTDPPSKTNPASAPTEPRVLLPQGQPNPETPAPEASNAMPQLGNAVPEANRSGGSTTAETRDTAPDLAEVSTEIANRHRTAETRGTAPEAPEVSTEIANRNRKTAEARDTAPDAASAAVKPGSITTETDSAVPEVGVAASEAGSTMRKVAGTSALPKTGVPAPEGKDTVLEVSSSRVAARDARAEVSSAVLKAGSTALEAGVTARAAGNAAPSAGSATAEVAKTAPKAGVDAPEAGNAEFKTGRLAPEVAGKSPARTHEPPEPAQALRPKRADSANIGQASQEPAESPGLRPPQATAATPEIPAEGPAPLPLKQIAETGKAPSPAPEMRALETAVPDPRPRQLKEVSLVVPGRPAAGRAQDAVEVRLVERRGGLEVSVHTRDSELARSMREGIGDLVTRLDQKGFRTETWHPAETYAGAGGSSRNLPDGDGAAPRDFQRHGSGTGGGEPRHSKRDQQDQPRWARTLAGAGLKTDKELR